MCGPCSSPADDLACDAAYGGSTGSHVCVAGACAPCDAVGTAYVVDPVAGNDATATGSGSSGGVSAGACAFKTVTAAIKAIGANANQKKLTIEIVGPSTVVAGETFPWVVPRNTTITTRGGAVTVAPVGSNLRTITLAEAGAGVSAPLGLTIDGQDMTGTSRGVVFDTGADDTTSLRHVRIRRFPGAGIAVAATPRAGFPATRGSVLQGVEVDECGGSASGAAVVVGDGAVFLTIAVSAGEAPTKITRSPGTGLRVMGAAGVKLTGAIDLSAPAGLLELSDNAAMGADVQHGPNGTASSLTGVLLRGNGKGNTPGPGLRVNLFSKLKVRGCASLDNGDHGVLVISPGAISGNLTPGVDLGVDNDLGGNVLQDETSGLRNPMSGVCFSAPAAGIYTIPARGNTFSADKTCATKAKVLKFSSSCKDADVGVLGGNPSATVDTLLCTQL